MNQLVHYFLLQVTLSAAFPIENRRQTAPVTIVAKSSFKWDLRNNCGPRPQGPRYPSPPFNGTGLPHDAIPCDIIVNGTYITPYKCSTSCQMDDTKQVELICDCHKKVGFVLLTKACEWIYAENTRCPAVPWNEQFDWECDPRTEICAAGQYLSETTTTITPSTPTTTQHSTKASTLPPTVSMSSDPGEPINNLDRHNDRGSMGGGSTIINFNPILSNNLEGISANSESQPGHGGYWQAPQNHFHYQNTNPSHSTSNHNVNASPEQAHDNDVEASGFYFSDDSDEASYGGSYNNDEFDDLSKKAAKLVEKLRRVRLRNQRDDLKKKVSFLSHLMELGNFNITVGHVLDHL